jgi:hypothetical protein
VGGDDTLEISGGTLTAGGGTLIASDGTLPVGGGTVRLVMVAVSSVTLAVGGDTLTVGGDTSMIDDPFAVDGGTRWAMPSIHSVELLPAWLGRIVTRPHNTLMFVSIRRRSDLACRRMQIREEFFYLLFTLLFSICSIFICRSDQASCQHGPRQHHDQGHLDNAIANMVIGNTTPNVASAMPLSAWRSGDNMPSQHDSAATTCHDQRRLGSAITNKTR